MADGLMLPIVIGSLYLIFTRVKNSQRYEKYCHIALAGITAYAGAKIIGLFFQPETHRPFEQLGQQAGAAYLNNPGFPSDHVLFATFLVLAVWYVTKSPRATLILAGMAVFMAVGRVLALVHTPLDVIGGFAIAVIGIVWYGRSFFAKPIAKISKT